SPQLNLVVYGFTYTLNFTETIRWGGYRPLVFLGNGLEVGLFMAVASVVGYWLWQARVLIEGRGLRFGPLVVALTVTPLMCQSTGVWFLLALGVGMWYAAGWSKSRLPFLLLVLLPPSYIVTRSTGLWSGREMIEATRSLLGDERAASVETRVFNENILVRKAL